MRHLYSNINGMRQDNANAAYDLAQTNGLSTPHPSPLLYLPTIFAFESVPIDIMHLLYCNVGPNVFNLMVSSDPDHEDIACLRDKAGYGGVNTTLVHSRSGISEGLSKYPRGLDRIKTWKATEWKHFMNSTSLVALHGWVAEEVLNGWWVLVQLCELISQWYLTEALVDRIELLAHTFFNNLIEKYYKLKP